MIIGIDLNSRSVAMALLPMGEERTPRLQKHTVKVGTHAVLDRAAVLGELYEWVTGRVFPEDVVYVEAPVLAGARNIQSTIKVAAAYGAVLAAVNSRHARVVEVAVSSWKVATVGNGNASKSAVGNWLHVQHPSVHRQCAGDQDLMDAYCIALYADLTERSSDAGARERRLLHQAP